MHGRLSLHPEASETDNFNITVITERMTAERETAETLTDLKQIETHT